MRGPQQIQRRGFGRFGRGLQPPQRIARLHALLHLGGGLLGAATADELQAFAIGGEGRVGLVDPREEEARQFRPEAAAESSPREAEKGPCAFAAALDQPRLREQTQMSAHPWLALAENLGQFRDGQFAMRQKRENPQASLLASAPQGRQQIFESARRHAPLMAPSPDCGKPAAALGKLTPRRRKIRSDSGDRGRAGLFRASAYAGGNQSMRMRRLASGMAALAALAALAGCASGAAQQVAGDGLIADPYESTNRAIHGFNKAADRVALRPAAQVYEAATPGLVKHLLGNAANHLSLPSEAVQGALRGDLRSAAISTGRFGVNTVAGAGGLLDPATEFGLPRQPEDFGRTLAAWGAPEGPYVELPLLGPSTARDTAGHIGGALLDPVGWIAPAIGSGYAAIPPAATAVSAVQFRAENMDSLDTVLDSADSYAVAKSLWLQQRRALIQSGDPSSAPPPPDIYEDEPF